MKDRILVDKNSVFQSPCLPANLPALIQFIGWSGILMRDNILFFKEDTIIIVEKFPLATGSTGMIHINLPERASIQRLTIRGKVIKCLPVCISKQEFYLIKFEVSSIDKAARLILKAYVKYLDRETLLNSIFKNIITDSNTSGDKFQEELDIKKEEVMEYLLAQINDIPFN